MEEKQKKYDGSSIQVLEGLEAVRKRPGMYIGNVDTKGLHHLIWEIVDNSVDEALAGHANEISLTVHSNESITISDNGRGIPVDIHKQTGKSTLETVFTILHAGGKFGGENSGYKVSGGLHGVGASVVNALSSWLHVNVHKDGKEFLIEFKNGGKLSKNVFEVGRSEQTGTSVTFMPDFDLFHEGVEQFDFEIIKKRLKETAFLNKGLKIDLKDERSDESLTFCFEGGIVDFLNDLNKHIEKVNTEIVYNNGTTNGVTVEVAMQYTTAYHSTVLSYVNNVCTLEGGTHVQGFFDATQRIINNYANEKLPAKEKQTFLLEDIKEGLTAIISIKHPDPMYEGQTKGKLTNIEVRKIVNNIISTQYEKFLMENPVQATHILQKMLIAAKSRIAAQKAKEVTRRKDVLEFSTLPGKLADCSSRDRESTELFIVEGDSAGGSAKMGRNRDIQAILPLRGKVINAERARIDKLFANIEITSLITALGTSIGEEFDIEKLRYGKIIIMTDADVDGSHIRTLLLTFFFRYFRNLIDNGNIYIACPPLYKIYSSSKETYVYSDKEKELFLSENEGTKFNIQRYKGLGEMNEQQLWETTMDPSSRKLLKVTIEDASRAEEVFSNLMGELVEPRKEFINKNAKYAKLDI